MTAKVRKVIKKCSVWEVFSTKQYGVPSTSALLEYRREGSRRFEVTGVQFARPFSYKVGKKEEGCLIALPNKVTTMWMIYIKKINHICSCVSMLHV